jgi:hypothetical protein
MPAKMVRAKARQNFVQKARQDNLYKSPPKYRKIARQNDFNKSPPKWRAEKARQNVVHPILVMPNVYR